MCILDNDRRTIELLFQPKRKKNKDLRCEVTNGNFRILIRPIHTTTEVMTHCISTQDSKIINIINSIMWELANLSGDIHVVIEGYAFNMQSSSCSILHELGGALKYCLNKNNIPYSIKPPTKIKKNFTGNGRASKRDMYNAFVTNLSVDLFTIFRMKDNDSKNIPNPIQDIVDAFAIVFPTIFLYTLPDATQDDKKNIPCVLPQLG